MNAKILNIHDFLHYPETQGTYTDVTPLGSPKELVIYNVVIDGLTDYVTRKTRTKHRSKQ